MAQTYNPTPLDALPTPQITPPQYAPPQLSAPPDQGIGAGYMGKPGQIADIASNFLQGWVQGKQKAAAHKLQQAQQSVEGASYAFKIAQDNASQVMNDPNATPEQKQKAESARQQAWKGYLDIAQQYTEPDKGGKGQKKGGAKGAFDAIGHHLKNAFGTENPEIFSQATMALLRTTGPPSVPQKSSQDQQADLALAGEKEWHKAMDQIEDARKRGVKDDSDEMKRLNQNLQDAWTRQKGPQSPKEQFDNALAQAAMDERAGKPINDATKAQLQAAGYDPKPVMPNQFQRIAPDGMMWVDSIDPQSGKVISSTKVGATKVPPDQRREAQEIFQENLKELGQMLKQAHPDWSQQQIDQAKAQAMLSKEFGIKVAPGMSPAQTKRATSDAIQNATIQGLDDDEREEAKKYGLFGSSGGSFFLTGDTSKAGGISGFFGTMTGGMVGGISQSKAKTLDQKMRDSARNYLANQKDANGDSRYSPEQIDAMIPQTADEAKKRFQASSLDNTSDGGKKTAKKEDVQAYATANNMSYDDAVKKVTDEGYEILDK